MLIAVQVVLISRTALYVSGMSFVFVVISLIRFVGLESENILMFSRVRDVQLV
jgi:hypothetical protein